MASFVASTDVLREDAPLLTYIPAPTKPKTVNPAMETHGNSSAFNFVQLMPEDVPGAVITKDPADCTNLELQRWLECRGLNKTGLKAELITRVKEGLHRSDLPIDPRIDNGVPYQVKLSKKPSVAQILDGVEIPLVTMDVPVSGFPTSGWTSFPSRNIPEMFNYGNIYQYLVESLNNIMCPGYNDGTEKPLKKGLALKDSGFVHNVTDHQVGNFYFISGHVHRSMKTKEGPQHVIVALSLASGSVQLANCKNCIVEDLGRCCHIAALLFHLWDYVKQNGHQVVAPSTSLPCTWNKGQKRKKDPKPLHLTNYGPKHRTINKMYSFDPRRKELRGDNQENVNRFYEAMKSISPINMWSETLQPEYSYQDFVIDSTYAASLRTMVANFKSNIMEEIEPLAGNRNSVQIPGTEQQTDSESWHMERRFRITASTAQRVYSFGRRLNSNVKPKWEKFINKKLWCNDSFVPTADMAYGISEEGTARQRYSETMNVVVRESGLWVNKKYPHLGASPDGLLEDGGIIEIKCLKILRERSVGDLIKTHTTVPNIGQQCFFVDDGKLLLRRNHPYYYQIQLQLMVTEALYCDFVLHSPLGSPSIERITPDNTPDNNLIDSISDYTREFWERVLIPEYFLMRIPRDLSALDIEKFEVDFMIGA